MPSELPVQDRRGPALVAMLLFIALTLASVLVGGSRPAGHAGTAPWLLQVAGYLCAIAGGVLLLTSRADRGGRRLGAVVLGTLLVLVLVDVSSLAGDGGADIGGGLVRVVGLLVLAAVAARLATAVAAARRERP